MWLIICILKIFYIFKNILRHSTLWIVLSFTKLPSSIHPSSYLLTLGTCRDSDTAYSEWVMALRRLTNVSQSDEESVPSQTHIMHTRACLGWCLWSFCLSPSQPHLTWGWQDFVQQSVKWKTNPDIVSRDFHLKRFLQGRGKGYCNRKGKLFLLPILVLSWGSVNRRWINKSKAWKFQHDSGALIRKWIPTDKT